MAQPKLSRAIKLYGTEVPDGKKRTLTAGPISAVLDNGALRYIRYRGVEVLRGIAYLVRDKNWGTYGPAIDGLKIRQGKDGFSVSYSATCKDGEQGIRYVAKIEASAKGVVTFSATGTPLSDFVTNRTGFVVLHPLVGVVGEPVEIVHTDGKKKKARFPKVISPGQPVFEIRSLKHQVMPGVTAMVLMEGNKFEMEDHRNWMDASYKTYVCSLLDPWPYTLKKGESFDQSITVTIEGKPKGKTAKASTGVTVALGGAKGKMPAIGAGIPMSQSALALDTAALIKTASPWHLVCAADGRGDFSAGIAGEFKTLRDETGAAVTLEIILPATGPAADEVATIAAAATAGGLKPDAVFITQRHDLKSFQPNTPRPWGPSYEEMAAAARQHFPGVPVGGGMYSYYTELNRKPVPAGLFDFVTHSVCPIVHAADDVSVMETLESLPSIIASTRAMIGKTPYHLGPSSIPCRDNPYGAAVAANPGNGRVCLSDHDPRQRGLLAAAWYVGLVAACAQGGVDAIALGSFTGPQGVIAAGQENTRLYPAYHVVSGFGDASRCRRLDAQSSAPSAVAAVAYQTKSGPVLWLANLTAQEQQVKVGPMTGAVTIRCLDETTFAAAAKSPGFLNSGGEPLPRSRRVALKPYAVARLAAAL